MSGVVLWEGPSELDGSPIIVIATGLSARSRNAKTGGMVQTYIIRSDMPPIDAVRSGADASICGGCRHRSNPDADGARTCYVTIAHGPRSVWDAYQRGRYQRASVEQWGDLFRKRRVRVGTYGDPAAVPSWVWRQIAAHCDGWTGYTHSDPTGVDGMVMLSVDSLEEATEAAIRGRRYFRVGRVGERPGPGEILCPASAEAGHKTTCERCGLCNGTRAGDKRPSIFIPAHGAVGRSRLKVLH